MEINAIQRCIETVLTELAGHGVDDKTRDTQLVFDTMNHHYLYMRYDWKDFTRRYDIYVHIEIRDGQIWVQRDNTDYGVVDELVRLGVPKSQIVLGFHPPYKRPYTGFAVG
jgi:hypothetical protein